MRLSHLIHEPMRRIAREIITFHLVIACALVVSGCHDASAPEADVTAKHVVSLTHLATPADTIDATLADALVITVRDGKGVPIPNASVRLEWSSSVAAGPVTMAPLGSTAFANSTILATDAQGTAHASLRLGRGIGRGFLTATETGKSSKDSVELSVGPGAFFRSTLSLRDTAMLVGGSITVSGSGFDRADNPIPLTLTSTGTACTLGPGGVITGTSPGACRINVSQAVGASFRVTVVAASLMFEAGSQVAIVRLDGTGRTRIPVVLAGFDTCGTVVSSVSFLCIRSGLLYLLGIDGTLTPIPTAGVARIQNVRVSGDRNWIVFTGYPPPKSNGNTTLYRARIDGSQLQVLSPDCCSISVPNFDVSFDGKVVFYSSYSTLRLDVASGITTTITLGRDRIPRFSPDGSTIAYLDGLEVWLSNADGSNMRVLYTSPRPDVGPYFQHLEWSPDSKWLLTLGYGDKPFLIAADGSATLGVNITSVRSFLP